MSRLNNEQRPNLSNIENIPEVAQLLIARMHRALMPREGSNPPLIHGILIENELIPELLHSNSPSNGATLMVLLPDSFEGVLSEASTLCPEIKIFTDQSGVTQFPALCWCSAAHCELLFDVVFACDIYQRQVLDWSEAGGPETKAVATSESAKIWTNVVFVSRESIAIGGHEIDVSFYERFCEAETAAQDIPRNDQNFGGLGSIEGILRHRSVVMRNYMKEVGRVVRGNSLQPGFEGRSYALAEYADFLGCGNEDELVAHEEFFV